MTNLHRFKIFIHGISWTLLMFAVAVRFNLVFAWIIALAVLFFPGTHRHSIIWIHAFVINGFLPAYLLYFYPYIQSGMSKIKKGLIFAGFLGLVAITFFFIGPIYFVFIPLPVVLTMILSQDIFYIYHQIRSKNSLMLYVRQLSSHYLILCISVLFIFIPIHMAEWNEAKQMLPQLGSRSAEYDQKYDIYQKQLEDYFDIAKRGKNSTLSMSVAILRKEGGNLADYNVYRSAKMFFKNFYYIVENYILYPGWMPRYLLSSFFSDYSRYLLSPPAQILWFFGTLNNLNLFLIFIILFLFQWHKLPERRIPNLIALSPLIIYSIWLAFMFILNPYLYGHFEISSMPIMPLTLLIVGTSCYYGMAICCLGRRQ